MDIRVAAFITLLFFPHFLWERILFNSAYHYQKKDSISSTPPLTSPTPEPKRVAIEESKEKLKLEQTIQLDRQAFLKSFQRQASLSLIECLSETIGKGPHVFSAFLTRSGHLINPSIVTSQENWVLPPCAHSFLEKMTFPEITQHIKEASVEIQWLVDLDR